MVLPGIPRRFPAQVNPLESWILEADVFTLGVPGIPLDTGSPQD